MKYSIIVLIENGHEDSVQFIRSLFELFSARNKPFEMLAIANGASGQIRNKLKRLMVDIPDLRAFEFKTKTAQAVCLKTGFAESSGDIVVVCDAYQQITNESLSELLDSMTVGTDVVTPWRQRRVDSAFNQFQSKVFNALAGMLTGSKFHDLSCTVKVFRREVFEDTRIYGNMYRFLPILAERRGFKAKEVKCEHYQQRGVTGFFAFLRYFFTRAVDIATLYFNTRFTRKPLRFFSTIGLVFLIIGLVITLFVFGQKLFLGSPIGGRPELLLAILFSVLGVQAVSVGLLGEIIAFSYGRHRKEYTIEKII